MSLTISDVQNFIDDNRNFSDQNNAANTDGRRQISVTRGQIIDALADDESPEDDIKIIDAAIQEYMPLWNDYLTVDA